MFLPIKFLSLTKYPLNTLILKKKTKSPIKSPQVVQNSITKWCITRYKVFVLSKLLYGILDRNIFVCNQRVVDNIGSMLIQVFL